MIAMVVSLTAQPDVILIKNASCQLARHERATDRNHAPYHQPYPHRHRDRSGPGELALPGKGDA